MVVKQEHDLKVRIRFNRRQLCKPRTGRSVPQMCKIGERVWREAWAEHLHGFAACLTIIRIHAARIIFHLLLFPLLFLSLSLTLSFCFILFLFLRSSRWVLCLLGSLLATFGDDNGWYFRGREGVEKGVPQMEHRIHRWLEIAVWQVQKLSNQRMQIRWKCIILF